LFVLEFRDFLRECQEKIELEIKIKIEIEVEPREISEAYFTGEVEVNGIIETSGVSFEYLNAEGV